MLFDWIEEKLGSWRKAAALDFRGGGCEGAGVWLADLSAWGVGAPSVHPEKGCGAEHVCCSPRCRLGSGKTSEAAE